MKGVLIPSILPVEIIYDVCTSHIAKKTLSTPFLITKLKVKHKMKCNYISYIYFTRNCTDCFTHMHATVSHFVLHSHATFPNAWKIAMAALNCVSPPFPNNEVVLDTP